jgi:2-polyprenyl-3-methyl-5-hydroxy-6-metoxy-1,4-benzoquinol methylase
VYLRRLKATHRRIQLSSQWFETFFQGVAVEFWGKIIPPELTAMEVAFLKRALMLKPGDAVLDVPCGNGRHTIELAREGFRLTGLDLSREFLDKAAATAEQAGVSVEWICADMRDLPRNAGFDAAFCMCNSFGYLDRTESHRFLSALAESLKTGGRVVVDTGIAAESILPTLLPGRWHRAGDMLMLSTARYVAEESRLDIDYTFVNNGVFETRPMSSYVFTAGEMRHMFVTAGFDVLAMNAGLEGEAYKLGSPRLVITARKAVE